MYIGFGFSPSKPRKAGGVANDPDAEAFFTATGITDATQKSAVNQLVLDLKSYNIWTKMKAIYPMVGGTSTTHKYNLKDPQDTNGAFRLVFSGGMTHSSTGILFSGVNGYANTFLNDTVINSSGHISFYSRTLTVGNAIEMGVWNNNLPIFQNRVAANVFFGNNSLSYTTTADARGFWLGTKRNNSDRECYRNGISQASSTATDNNISFGLPYYIGARNTNNTTIQFPTSKECAFASLGDGLTDTDAANFYTAVQNLNTTLGRQV
jgi:hypothetical protein